MRLFQVALPFFLVTACGGPPPAPPPAPPPEVPVEPAPVAQDALAAAPANYRLLAESDVVRVLEVTIPVGGTVPQHTHPDHVVYVLSGGKMKETTADGASHDLDLVAGGAVYMPATTHSATNVGDTELKAVVVELKQHGAAAPAGTEPLSVPNTLYKSVFENDRVRVMEVTFPKGAKMPDHAHPDHVAYIVTGGKLRLTEAGKPSQDMDLAADSAVILPAQVHAAENIGDTEIKIAVFEVK